MDNDAAPSGTPSAEGSPSGEANELKAARTENLRLRQELGKVQETQARTAPVLQTLRRWSEEGGEGKAIVQKILAGESLTKKEQAKAEGAIEGNFVTKEDLVEFRENLASDIEERMIVTEGAREGKKTLDSWASKEYPGYDGLRGSAAWKRRLAKNVDLLSEEVQKGETTVPEKFGTSDPTDALFRWAVDQTFAQVKADNPSLGTKKRVKDGAPEEREALKRAASTASGSGGDMDDIPEEKREEIASIRRLGSGGTAGKSWSQRARASR